MPIVENESRIVWLYLGSSLILAVLLTLIWEMYLHGKDQMQELSARIDELEAKNQTSISPEERE